MAGAERSIPHATRSRPVWLSVGTLIDGLSQAPLHNAHIVYGPEAIRYAGAGPPPPDLVQPGQTRPDAELSGHTVLPGLVEAHAHLALEGGELDGRRRSLLRRETPEALLRRARERLERLVLLGIVAVRDAGDRSGVGLALSRLCMGSARPLMPHVDSPGAAIHHRGCYGGFIARPLEEFPAPEACVAARIASGADRIKLIATGVIDFRTGSVTQPPQMSAEEIALLVQAARVPGRQTFAHASGDAGIEHAVEGGVDSIEHGYFIRDDQLLRMADRQIAWVPTCAPLQKQIDHAERIGWDQRTVSQLRRILERHAGSMLRAEAAGVTIIAGSDAGSYGVAHGFGLLDELEWMRQAGLSSLSVLNAATGRGAARLAFREPVGRLRAGYRSRFLITEHSPLESVTNLRKEKVVIYDGIPLTSPAEIPAAGM